MASSPSHTFSPTVGDTQGAIREEEEEERQRMAEKAKKLQAMVSKEQVEAQLLQPSTPPPQPWRQPLTPTLDTAH